MIQGVPEELQSALEICLVSILIVIIFGFYAPILVADSTFRPELLEELRRKSLEGRSGPAFIATKFKFGEHRGARAY